MRGCKKIKKWFLKFCAIFQKKKKERKLKWKTKWRFSSKIILIKKKINQIEEKEKSLKWKFDFLLLLGGFRFFLNRIQHKFFSNSWDRRKEKVRKVENYKDYHHQQLQQQQNYRHNDKDMLMDKTKQKSELNLNIFFRRGKFLGRKHRHFRFTGSTGCWFAGKTITTTTATRDLCCFAIAFRWRQTRHTLKSCCCCCAVNRWQLEAFLFLFFLSFSSWTKKKKKKKFCWE